MTTDDVKKTVKKHRPAAMLGVLFGVGVLGGWVTYVLATTPSVPAIGKATAEEVVAYVANKRGLAKLSQVEQEEFLERWQLHISKPENKPELKACLKDMPQVDRKEFSEAIFKHLKRSFVDDAEHFSGLKDAAEQSQFLRSKVEQLHSQALFIKDIAQEFRKDFPGGPNEFNAWLLERTTPREQAIGEPYLAALKRVGTQMKKEARAQPESVSAAPQP